MRCSGHEMSLPRSRTRAPPTSISMTPPAAARAKLARTAGAGIGIGKSMIALAGGKGSMVTGSSTACVTGLSRDGRLDCARRHLNSKLALMPCVSAMAATEAPASSASLTSLRLKAALCLRLVALRGSLRGSMTVCTCPG